MSDFRSLWQTCRHCGRFYVRFHVHSNQRPSRGLVLYNGGFTSGITALILLPILEHYIPKTRDFMNNKKLNKEEMIAIVETFKTHD